jgi:hypothetical protein
MTRLLTIGMPTYDDWDGVFFSLQSLRMHHAEVAEQVEFVVIDNHPDSTHGQHCKRLLDSIPNGRYLPETEWQGPWVKDLVIRKAETPYALCMDSHVLLDHGSLRRLVEFFTQLEQGTLPVLPGARQPRRSDLFHGPLLYNDLTTVSTHFELVWRGQMWGIWATDDRGRQASGQPFEIPAQGMGLFACAVDAWGQAGGFNRMMRGFGGEEGYIHAKFRKRGGTVWCLPFLRWLHRFDRSSVVTYPLTWENKVRNYYIGFIENGMDVEPIIQHFSRWQSRADLEKLLDQTRREITLEQVRQFGRPMIPTSCQLELQHAVD